MKTLQQTLAALSILSLGLFAVPTGASAQCIQSDVSVQASISGSRTPTTQRNRTTMRSNGPCSGTTVHTQGVQVRTGGTQSGSQIRAVDSEITPGAGNGTGVDIPPVQVRSNAQIDVYNTADQ